MFVIIQPGSHCQVCVVSELLLLYNTRPLGPQLTVGGGRETNW